MVLSIILYTNLGLDWTETVEKGDQVEKLDSSVMK